MQSDDLRVSVVIPTYNRGESLRASIESLLRSDSTGLNAVEVIVVDDGSTTPAAEVVESIGVRHPFSLRCIRQANSGPAAARNAGFRGCCGDVVIFMDDDIVGPPDLIRKHLEAHALHPGSVIFGRSLLARPTSATSLFTFLNSLGSDAGENASEDFIRSDFVASGHLSVERGMFDPTHGVYCDGLLTPGAEEWEFSCRLRQRGIPLTMATRIVATHHQSAELRAVCVQEYKHAMGCAEVAKKYPEMLKDTALFNIVRVNGPITGDDSVFSAVMKGIKAVLSIGPIRLAVVKVTLLGERMGLVESWLRRLYRAALGIYFFAGVRHGLRRYTK